MKNINFLQLNKMSTILCNKCSKNYNIKDRKPLLLPCGDVFCEECIKELYERKNRAITCPYHKDNIIKDVNNIPICTKLFLDIKNKPLGEYNNNYLYCDRHKKRRVQFYCENDNLFFCDFCIQEHNGHSYKEFNLSKDNIYSEFKQIKMSFEVIKNKYIYDKCRINEYISFIKNNADEQINKINNYFEHITNIINEIKLKYITNVKNSSNYQLKNLKEIQNNFQFSDEKYLFLNNEIDYIDKEILMKGHYETFFNIKNNFFEKIGNFENYVNTHILNIIEMINNNKILYYIVPKEEIFNNKSKEEEIFGILEEKELHDDKEFIKNLEFQKKNNFQYLPTNEKDNNNVSTSNSFMDKKSYMNNNNNDSFIEKQLIDTGYTFFILNKNDVKNVFKQQESEQSQNEPSNNENSNNKKKEDNVTNNIIKHLNDLNRIKSGNLLNYKNKKNTTKNINYFPEINSKSNLTNMLTNINKSGSPNAERPLKLLNINNTKTNHYYKKIKDNNRYKLKSNNEKILTHKELNIKKSFYEKERNSHLLSNNNIIFNKNKNYFIKSEEILKNKIIKAKIQSSSKKRDNSSKRRHIRGLSNNNVDKVGKKIIVKNLSNNHPNRHISFLSNFNSNSIIADKLINSYNRDSTSDLTIFKKTNNNSKTKNTQSKKLVNSQILTEVNNENMNLKYKNKIQQLIRETSPPNGKYLELNDKMPKTRLKFKKTSQPRFSLNELNFLNSKGYRNPYYENINANHYLNYDRVIKRGNSVRQKYSNSEMNILDFE